MQRERSYKIYSFLMQKLIENSPKIFKISRNSKWFARRRTIFELWKLQLPFLKYIKEKPFQFQLETFSSNFHNSAWTLNFTWHIYSSVTVVFLKKCKFWRSLSRASSFRKNSFYSFVVQFCIFKLGFWYEVTRKHLIFETIDHQFPL